MKTYPIENEQGKLHAFEIDNFRIGRSGATKVIAGVPGVVVLRQPKKLFSWFREEVFCEFELKGICFQIDEPYGDNSRYWIGQKEEGSWSPQLDIIHQAFLSV
jgi:hypothetical protein